MFITCPGATLKLLVWFADSREPETSPYRPGDGDARETAPARSARWALRLANGRDPGTLYARPLADGRTKYWTRRRRGVRSVVVGLDLRGVR